MKKRTWWRIAIMIILLLLLGVGAYGYSIYHHLTSTVKSIHEPIQREESDKRLERQAIENQVPFSVLLLGVDEREGDKGRSDTTLVLTVNPKQNSIKMLSIPRDTRTEIIGRNIEDKINHAYAFGDIQMSIATVENLLNIPIDYYVKVNMEGFKEIVDAVGGVTINNRENFVQDGKTFKKGTLELTGEDALAYVRMRKQDPKGDFGRQKRQRQLIQGIIKKGASIASLTRYEEILNAVGHNVKTNLNLGEMFDIQQNYNIVESNVEQLQLSGTGQMIDGIYYQVITEEVKQKIQNVLKKHLEIL